MQTEVNEIKCPRCGSNEIAKPRLSAQAFAISVLMLGFPFPFLKTKYHCFDCGLDFRKQKKVKSKNYFCPSICSVTSFPSLFFLESRIRRLFFVRERDMPNTQTAMAKENMINRYSIVN